MLRIALADASHRYQHASFSHSNLESIDQEGVVQFAAMQKERGGTSPGPAAFLSLSTSAKKILRMTHTL